MFRTLLAAWSSESPFLTPACEPGQLYSSAELLQCVDDCDEGWGPNSDSATLAWCVELPTTAPTAGPTEAPTEAPTGDATDAPTEAPTDRLKCSSGRRVKRIQYY